MLLGSNLFVFDAFLSNYTRADEDEYVAVRLLSAPAQGGYRRFKAACAECHGTGGQGTDTGPRLTGRSYASDFREARAFHSKTGRTIPAHRAVMGDAPGFNDVEMMGKFLRELRQQIARRDGA